MAEDGRTPTAAAGADSDLVVMAIEAARAGDLEACQFLYVRYADEVVDELGHLAVGQQVRERIMTGFFLDLRGSIGEYDRRACPCFEDWVRDLARRSAARVSPSG